MNRTVLVIAALLLSCWVLWQWLQPVAAPQSMPELTRFNQDQIKRVSLNVGSREVLSLLFQDDVWLLGDDSLARADENAVFRLLDDLRDMEPLRVVTRNPERHQRLQVHEGSTRLVLKDDSDHVLLDVYVGKQGSDLISTYIRLANSPEVVAVDRALAWQVRRSPGAWKVAEAETGDE